MNKVSLILTTYNSKDNLLKTINSIESQDYPEIEVVIKDGESTDGTLEIIKEYQEKSKYRVVWESKKDTGIYDAMNQGYMISSGEVIAFFNDIFTTDSAISKLIAKMGEINPLTKKKYVGVHANLIYADGEKIIRKWEMGNGDIHQGWMPGHPTLFLKREIYEKYGLYNTNFKIAADYEFMIRFLKDGENQIAYIPETLVSMFYGGTSSGGMHSYLISLKEGHKALKINGIKWAFYVDIRRTIRVLKQFC